MPVPGKTGTDTLQFRSFREKGGQKSEASVTSNRYQPSQQRKKPWRLFPIKREKVVLGLDIGSHTIKYALLKHTMDGPVLKDVGMTVLPALPDETVSSDEDGYAECIRHLIKARGLQADRVVVGLSGPQVAARRMLVPRVPSRELRQSIFWAARKELPFSHGDFRFDYRIMSEEGNQKQKRLDALVVAAETPAVDRIVTIMKKAGLRLDGITSVPMALWSIQRATAAASQNTPAVFVDLGHRATTFAFFDAGKLAFTREVFTAGQSLAASVAGHTATTPQEQRGPEGPFTVKAVDDGDGALQGDDGHACDDLHSSGPVERQSPALKRLVNEIDRSLDYYQSLYPQAPVEPLYISGGVACSEGFDRLLTEKLGLEVQRLNPFLCLRADPSAFGASPSEDVFPLYGVAVGLALDDGRGINLLPREQRSRRDIALDRFVVPAGFAATAIALLMAALLGYYTARVESTRKSAAEIRAYYQDLTRIEMEEAQRLASQEAQVALSRQLLSYLNYRPSRAPAVMKEIGVITPADISFDAVTIDKKRTDAPANPSLSSDGATYFLEIKGSVSGNPSMQGAVLTQFMLALQESPFFKLPRLIRHTFDGDGVSARLNFSVECVMDVELREIP